MPGETQPPAPPAPVPPSAPVTQKASSISHTPMTEEFDRAKWTLPPLAPVLIGLALVAIVVSVVLFTTRAKPHASGEITKMVAVEPGDSLLVAVQMRLDNLTDRALWVRTITSELETADGKKFTDSSAPATDINRFLKGFPALAEAQAEPLREEMKVPPASSFTGMTIFAFPVSKADFDARKAVTVTIEIYDRSPLVLKK